MSRTSRRSARRRLRAIKCAPTRITGECPLSCLPRNASSDFGSLDACKHGAAIPLFLKKQEMAESAKLSEFEENA